ncbi:MAG: N-acetylmuramoyl-L-alanine amidase [Anaerolineales bacterium]|nr:N-acetylmuramoyl-L-alanine amidase [Anaerolineales bacterium]
MQRSPSFFYILGQTARQIGLVVVVGMTLATVFTVWTPGTFSPATLITQLAGALNVQRVESVSTPAAVALPPTAVPARPLIGLVAGHKGNDSGAVCADGLTEAQVNYDIALRVQAGLEANGFQVDVLDEFDPRLDQYQALALVSIHNDSCDYINDLATGYKVAGALESRARDKSARLAACLTDRYAKATGLGFHANTVTRDMTQYHSFYEIADTTPAAIIETGFLNLDRKILTEEPYRVAQGLIDGIVCYARGEPVGASSP